MVSRTPIVSLICYLDDKKTFNKSSLTSILNQTVTDFEFIIINESTSENIHEYIKLLKDDRIIYIRNNKPKGFSQSLNYGIKCSKAPYIAIVSSDSISANNRLEKQVAIMEDSAKITICSAQYYKPDTKEFPIFIHDNIKHRVYLLRNNTVAASSVMMRKSSILNYQLKFDKSAGSAAEYKFVVDCAINNLKIETIRETLIFFDSNSELIQSKYAPTEFHQLSNLIKFQYAYFYFPSILKKHGATYMRLILGKQNDTGKLEEYENLVKLLIEENQKTKRFDPKHYNHLLVSTLLGLKLIAIEY